MELKEWENFETNEKVSKELSQAIWNKINLKIKLERANKLNQFKKMAVAACLIFTLLGLGKFFLEMDFNKFSVHNKTNQNQICFLPDGSEVNLFSNSYLEYFYNKENNERNVLLNGKAIFKVKKNAEKPFIVKNKYIEVKALGTIFLVDGSLNDKEIKVKLIEGSIEVNQLKSVVKINTQYKAIPQILKVGEVIEYSKNNVEPIKKMTFYSKTNYSNIDINNSNFIDKFIENESIEFNQENLYKVFNILSKIYEKEIIIENKNLEKYFFSGIFSNKESLDNIIHKISKLNKLNHKTEQNKIIIF